VRRSRWTWVASVIAIASFCYYAHYRAHFIGGCDSSAYFAESLRMLGHDDFLARDPAVPQQGALVPLCMVDHLGVVRSFFPPGFSILLAAFGIVGLEFHVTALLGALGGFSLFVLARARAGAPIAVATMTAWLVAPLTIWGSTMIMSDVSVAALLLIALALAERGRAFLAGLVMGFALGVRPASMLFLPALVFFVQWPVAPSVGARPTALARLVAGGSVAALAWLAFMLVSFGGLDIPYTGNLSIMSGERFGQHTRFFLTEIVTQQAPAAGLAVVALVRSPRGSIPYLLWLVPFVVFHAFWGGPLDAWWQARFIAPALPAIFLLAAVGAATLRDATKAAPRAFAFVGTIGLVLYAAWGLSLSPAKHIRSTTWDERYATGARHVASAVPTDALIGAVTFTMPLRYYGGRQSFTWFDRDAPSLIRWALGAGRPVYAVLDPIEQAVQTDAPALRRELDFTVLEDLGYGVHWMKLSRATELAAIDVGEASARDAYLREGWSADENDGLVSFARVLGDRATLAAPPGLPTDADVRVLVALTIGQGERGTLTIRADGALLGEDALDGGFQVVERPLPAHRTARELELAFTNRPPSPVRVDWVSFRPSR
jgi:hypothetical protein